MPVCGIYGCSNRPNIQKEFSYFKVPKILTNQGDKTRELSSERRRLWKAAINRKDIQSEEKMGKTPLFAQNILLVVSKYDICVYFSLNMKSFPFEIFSA